MLNGEPTMTDPTAMRPADLLDHPPNFAVHAGDLPPGRGGRQSAPPDTIASNSEPLKTCPRCQQALPISSFWRHSGLPDGRQVYCKGCALRYNTAYQQSHPDERRAYQRKFMLRKYWADPKAANARAKAWRDAHPERQRAYAKKSFKPEQRRASDAVSYAIKIGALVRQPCKQCGTEPSEAHHDDYARPLDVRWLCRRCHKRLHRQKRSTPLPPPSPQEVAL